MASRQCLRIVSSSHSYRGHHEYVFIQDVPARRTENSIQQVHAKCAFPPGQIITFISVLNFFPSFTHINRNRDDRNIYYDFRNRRAKRDFTENSIARFGVVRVFGPT